MDEVKLSIVTPVYNVSLYIERCVQSAVDQLGRGDEIILVDDGSTDDSGQYCDWFQRSYGDCIKVIHQQNKGLSEARNTGIREASGDYIVFLDSDDWLMRGALAQIKSILFKRRVDVLIGKFRAYQMPPKAGIFDDPTDFDKQLGGDELNAEHVKRGIFENNMMCTAWRNVVRREFIKRNALLFEPGILHEDEEWCPRLYAAAQSFAFNTRPFYAYRLRDGSIVYSRDWRKTLGLFAAVQMVSVTKERHPEMEKGLTRKYNELAGRALQTLPAFNDEERTRLFEALPKYPAMSRYILLLKGKGVIAANQEQAAPNRSSEAFEKIVTESDDGELLAKWALISYYTMMKSVREAIKNRSDTTAAASVESPAPTPTPKPAPSPMNRRPLKESMERMMQQGGATRLSNVQDPLAASVTTAATAATTAVTATAAIASAAASVATAVDKAQTQVQPESGQATIV
jgi:glycosyltransferase involved in cell wall biosynthesis